MKKPALIAIDLGGESCRVSLLRWHRNRPNVQAIHRFANGPIGKNSHLCWDIRRIEEGIETGLRMCAAATDESISAVGIDGWACDYVRIESNGEAVYDPFCYRDERTVEAEKQVHRIISREKLYQLTGIQVLRFNTLYQLYADQIDRRDENHPWLNIPEFIMHRLGGQPVAEYTNATHTGLISPETRSWLPQIFDETGLDATAAHRIVPPGSVIGKLTAIKDCSELRKAQLIVPACHDTASAIAGIPATDDDWAFISSGTWSLVGTLLDSPCVTPEAFAGNYSNLGGVGGNTCFLKNVNGMWLLTQCLSQWKSHGYELSLEDLFEGCSRLPAPQHLLDVDDPEFLVPGDLPAVINAHQLRAGETAFCDDGRGIVGMVNLILHSLAARYAHVLQEIIRITHKKIRRLYIVGGGSKNRFLNRLTAEWTGLDVALGAAESSTIGNFAVQLAALHGDHSRTLGANHLSVSMWAAELLADRR